MEKHIKKSHNKTQLLLHIVLPAKYRRKVFSDEVTKTLKEGCIAISERYEIHFVEIGSDVDHVHFLVQIVPSYRLSEIVITIKSITAREIFKKHPEVRKLLWGGKFWTSGYYMNTVSIYGNEESVRKYVQNQGKEYQQIHRGQLVLFSGLA